jgi:uncharacterized protein (TIGR02246 family)
MTIDELEGFGARYATAWSSRDAASVTSFFAEDGSLKINGAVPAIGRGAIRASVQGFMTTFPDLHVTMDQVYLEGNAAIFRWTLTGTNTGPGGTGRAVKISGYEEWTIGRDGLVAMSLGHFDAADYERQLHGNNGS